MSVFEPPWEEKENMKYVLLTFLLFPFVAYEGIRYYQAHRACIQERRENEAILQSITCDAWHRHQYGSKVNAVCVQAEREAQISSVSCAWKRMWSEGEVYRVWTMFTQSYVMLWATTVPIACFLISSWFGARNARARDERMITMQGEMYKKTLEMMKHTTPPPPAYVTPSLPQREEFVDLVDTRQRKKRFHLIQ